MTFNRGVCIMIHRTIHWVYSWRGCNLKVGTTSPRDGCIKLYNDAITFRDPLNDLVLWYITCLSFCFHVGFHASSLEFLPPRMLHNDETTTPSGCVTSFLLTN